LIHAKDEIWKMGQLTNRIDQLSFPDRRRLRAALSPLLALHRRTAISALTKSFAAKADLFCRLCVLSILIQSDLDRQTGDGTAALRLVPPPTSSRTNIVPGAIQYVVAIKFRRRFGSS
jgi:hypothetical protein